MREKKTTTTDQTIEQHVVENRWDRSLIVLACFLLFVASVVGVIGVIQGTVRNKKIDHIDRVVSDAKKAAESAQDTVDAAVAAQHTPEAEAQAKAVVEALGEIKEIRELIKEHIDAMNKFYGIPVQPK